mmetsp:Transcript_74060/g.205766  ORF Transcript_74060/g.205766 Transcript_74060/m.205766 type:complete len:201 (+) Transcript_74060:280-882(+)
MVVERRPIAVGEDGLRGGRCSGIVRGGSQNGLLQEGLATFFWGRRGLGLDEALQGRAGVERHPLPRVGHGVEARDGAARIAEVFHLPEEEEVFLRRAVVPQLGVFLPSGLVNAIRAWEKQDTRHRWRRDEAEQFFVQTEDVHKAPSAGKADATAERVEDVGIGLQREPLAAAVVGHPLAANVVVDGRQGVLGPGRHYGGD